MLWKNVYVFISSTFNDMHAERDYLVKYVFPELREWCLSYKVRLIEVDLRWGITEEESMQNQTVEICLDSINKCRPYFLCFLGQRRGWIPKADEVSDESKERYPQIKEFIESSVSITELEIQHAFFSPLKRNPGLKKDLIPVENAFFFFRDSSSLGKLEQDSLALFHIYKNIDDDEILARIKTVIRNRTPKVTDYFCTWDSSLYSPEMRDKSGKTDLCQGRLTDFRDSNGNELKESIVTQLKNAIRNDPALSDNFIEKNQTKSEDLMQQEMFLAHASANYIETKDEYAALIDYIESDTKNVFVLTAAKGQGKTAFLANFITKYANIYPIVYRFIGESQLSSDKKDVISSLLDETKSKYNNVDSSDLDDINKLIWTLRFYAYSNKNKYANEENYKKVILVLDNIMAIGEKAEDHLWYLRLAKNGIKVICSQDYISGQPLALQSIVNLPELYQTYNLPPFDNEKKQTLMENYFELYLKRIDEKQTNQIICNELFNNPSLLLTFLQEFRFFGSFDNLETELKLYGNNERTFFAHLINKSESEVAAIWKNRIPYAEKCFSLTLYSLAISKDGLMTSELVYILSKLIGTETPALLEGFIQYILFRFDQSIVFTGTLFKLTNSFFKERILEEYHKELHEISRKLLYNCFAHSAGEDTEKWCQNASKRVLNELPYYALMYSDEEYIKLLQDYRYLFSKFWKCGIENLLLDYRLNPSFPVLTSIELALRQSAAILKKNPDEFFFQLMKRIPLGYLSHVNDSSELLVPQNAERAQSFISSITVDSFYSQAFAVSKHNVWIQSDNELIKYSLKDKSNERYIVPDGQQWFISENDDVSVYDQSRKKLYFSCAIPKAMWQCIDFIDEKDLIKARIPSQEFVESVKCFNDCLYCIIHRLFFRAPAEAKEMWFVTKQSFKKDDYSVLVESAGRKIVDFIVDRERVFPIFQGNIVSINGNELCLNTTEQIQTIENGYLITQEKLSPDTSIVRIRNEIGQIVYEQSILGNGLLVADNWVYYNTPTDIICYNYCTKERKCIRHWLKKEKPFGLKDYIYCYHSHIKKYGNILITYNGGYRALVFFDLKKEEKKRFKHTFPDDLSLPYIIKDNYLYSFRRNKNELAIIDLDCLFADCDKDINAAILFLDQEYCYCKYLNYLFIRNYQRENILTVEETDNIQIIGGLKQNVFIYCKKVVDNSVLVVYHKTIDGWKKREYELQTEEVISLEILSSNEAAFVTSDYKACLINLNDGDIIEDFVNSAFVWEDNLLYQVDLTEYNRVLSVKKLGSLVMCVSQSCCFSSIWDTNRMKMVYKLESLHNALYTSFCPEPKLVMASNSIIIIYSGNSLKGSLMFYKYSFVGEKVDLIKTREEKNDRRMVTGFAQSKDYFFIATSTNEIEVFSIETLESVKRVTLDEPIVGLAYNNNCLYVNCNNQILRIKTQFKEQGE